MFMTRLSSLFSVVIGLMSGGLGDYFYRFFLFSVFIIFVGLRIPYLYGMGGFSVYIFFSMFPLFFSLLLARLLDDSLDKFFCGFVPMGTPLWIAPFVCLAESLSYLVRPVVLMMRPFVNLSMGAMGGYVLGMMVFSNWSALFFLFILFFYEVFVAVVHWFMVCSILSFSEDH